MKPSAAPAAGRIESSEHRLPLRVYYEDTDAAGIVYYANYLKFAERGRSEFLRLLGIDQLALRDGHGLVFAVRRAEIDYRLPARLDDQLEVRSRMLKVGGASVLADQQVLRRDEILAALRVRIACVQLDSGRPGRLPEEIRAALAPYSQSLVRE